MKITLNDQAVREGLAKIAASALTPFHSDPWLTVYQGDCRAVIEQLPDESVHCVVTSPPYWGLRDYGVSDQLGLEPTPEQYVENMVAVFREVRRVLRNDGTLWLNLGDSYAGSWGNYGARSGKQRELNEERLDRPGWDNYTALPPTANVPGLKPKDLVGIPWRVAFALQADGWYLRSDIIWSKPNPMPESVTDRPTKSHEYLFLLAKSERYYFDADAVREDADTAKWPGIGPKHGTTDNHKSDYNPMTVNAGRNIRSVWNIATQPYPGAHFATFPPKLVEPCIKAGTSERGVCPECGAPWRRVVDATKYEPPVVEAGVRFVDASRGDKTRKLSGAAYNEQVSRTTTGWQPACAHDAEPVPATVLDPFAGSGTTLMVAQQLSRRGLGIDLSMDYLSQLLERNRQTPLGLAG